MSYFNGITDSELRDEGWTEQQIAELRRIEKNKIYRQQKEHDELVKNHRKRFEAMSDSAKKAYMELTKIPFPVSRIYEEAERQGELMDARNRANAIRMMNKRWWQFWKS